MNRQWHIFGIRVETTSAVRARKVYQSSYKRYGMSYGREDEP
jgi:hypothetical protein